MENKENKEVVVMCVNNNSKPTMRDYIALGSGFYIGWTVTRALKYMLLARNIKKD